MTYRAKPSDGVAWVTGASSGIGRLLATALAERGYTVAATARRVEELERLADGPAGAGGRIVAHAGDVTDETRMAEIVETVERVHGPIALGFVNAGVFQVNAKKGFDLQSVRHTLNVNLIGAVNCLGPLIARMTERRKGQIAVTASIAGYGGLPDAAAYGASKAALIHMAESLKFMLDPLGVTIQVVAPGFIKTPMTAKNKFPMPFLMEADEAVRRTLDGLDSGGFEITFPKRLSWTLKLINLLPYALYFPLLAKGTAGRGISSSS